MAKLKRSLGTVSLSLYGLGAILGAGIYSVIGEGAGIAGEGLWLCFVGAGTVALLTALSYAELATLYPKAGGEFVYLRRALPEHDWVAFTVGTMVALSSAATVATVAIAFGGYLGEFVQLPAWIAASLLVFVLTLIGLWGVRESTLVTAVLTVVEVLGLGLVIWAGTQGGPLADALGTIPSFEMLTGASVVFFSFLGFENIVNLASETKDPGRSLPRAILASLCGAIVLYVLVALAVVAVAEPRELAESSAPLSTAVRKTSPELASALSAIALFATANTALASILSGSRVLFGMADERQLPDPLAAVLAGRKTPWVATLVLSGVAAALLPLGNVGAVASVSSFAALVAFLLVNVAVVVLRRRSPTLKRPFRVPLAVSGIPVPAALGAALTLLLLVRLPPLGIAIGASVLVALAVGRWLATRIASARHRRGAG